MSWVDAVIVAVVAGAVIQAFRQGLIQQVVSFLGVVVGVIAAGQLYGDLSSNLDFVGGGEQTRNLGAFVAIFAGVSVLGQLLATTVRTAASLLMLGWVDRLGGAALGLAQGLIVVQLLLIGATTFKPADAVEQGIEDSRIAPLFLERAPLLERVLPSEFRSALDAFQGAVPLPGGEQGGE